ncbi:CopG family ribbon-helix-helix protein [Herminiimonas sp.]|uniref:CopG family ribbon-helix-helix protein n=1 Tax=Herminiimonas sp. TaxID=1926289 RepID=UPI00271B17AD|nr:ribbon-helix-helix protein, CopG family [Herminiimonas sp.]MDO8305146.1 ribbon-helix-helix protein, CopG family [Herminiimonas sp.]
MKPSADTPMTVSLPADLASQLDKLTRATGRDKSAITIAALREYMEAEAWQIADIERGVAEAERGEFASASEVNSFFAKYGG